MVVAAVAALHLLRGTHPEAARVMMRMAMGFIAIVVPLQILAGHSHGENVYHYQPVKLAAMEGHWETWDRKAPLVLFGWPNEAAERNDYELAVPDIGSWIVTGSSEGSIRGLKEWAPEDRPPVAWVFWGFRIMVGVGLLMLFIGWFGAWRTWPGKGRYPPWFLRLCLVSGPVGFVAVISGWITAEVGRQPWTVQGLLRTVDSVSPVTPGAVGTSLIVFVFVYTIVFGAGALFMFRVAGKGPVPTPPPGTEPERPPLATWMSSESGRPGVPSGAPSGADG
jgi:cytochrome d ubiquinol oxidase subunit I